MIEGRSWKYGHDISTDLIFPGKHTYTARGSDEIRSHALEDLDPTFAGSVNQGDVIVAGRNWGCGSSREQAATCLVFAGVGAVIVESVARIFFRNAINNGLPVLVAPDAVAAIGPGDWVRIDLIDGVIHCPAGEYTFPRFGEGVRRILDAGGLIPMLQNRLQTD